MLMIVVLAKLGKAHCCVSLLVKGNMIASAQIAVSAGRPAAAETSWPADIPARSRQCSVPTGVTGCRFRRPPSESAGPALSSAVRRNAFGEHAHHMRILQCVPRRLIAADDIVVQRCLNIPALRLGHFGEMCAAIQALLLSGDGKKDDGRRKLVFAQHACTFHADRRAAAVVIGSGSLTAASLVSAVARIVVPGHQDDAVAFAASVPRSTA